MSHVFTRNASYYSPATGVLDIPAGTEMAPGEAGWVSSCGGFSVADEGVISHYQREGCLQPIAAAPDASTEDQDEALTDDVEEGELPDGDDGEPETTEQDDGEVPSESPPAETQAPRRPAKTPGRKPAAKARRG